ncbi:uncharacterized protein LOC125272991 isoform X1 [Megalobrama amblycephala]|uniref:uncharacterized protein LOC125272991 isoform X1 n=1 Tax=Megalobrama amblycephala TaxID=75352 RepID=UPI0020147976|nr:uncharacterized protein LOC125272991 isoform X1 [Megalobrama amblycephala]XP_048054161.1 uncharacterized protein LOC125272991 isoform X1 [Megalobrama amblycephala]
MKNYSKISLFLFIICVFGADEDDVKSVSVMEGDSVTLDTDLTEFNHINWLFGDSYSFISKSDGNEISYPLNDTERFRDRLKMNNQTGSLTINNTRITDSGDYHLRIDHDYVTSKKKYRVTVNGSSVSDSALSPFAVAAIVVVILLVFAVVIYCCNNSKQEGQNPVTDEEKTESTKEDVTNYQSAAAEDPNTRYSELLHMVPEEKMQMNLRDSTVE